LRSSLSQREPAYHGEYYDYEGLVVDPCAVQVRVPLWVGGRTKRSLRRAVELADGWCPFATAPATAAPWLRDVDLPEGFEVVLPAAGPLDPINEPGRTEDAVGTSVELGATIVSSGFATSSLEEYVEQMQGLADLRATMTKDHR
jgi:hypothetical protein